ncbi:hypothetical protein J1605_007091 [Eschrichtius robustus]|uniref:Uncharacterized protein n=1 Tax=Eschrichtius robustus TaxID=9764 RepID=A0AB34H458_ESCRO|nr:hypothetical protein J1605_007091 [Eschrichtius robustus]
MPRGNWAGEPQLLSLRIWSLCSATREAATGLTPEGCISQAFLSVGVWMDLANGRQWREIEEQTSYQEERQGFPGGAVVENLPANAGDTGSSPGLGRSHMPRSNQAREPQLLSLRVWSLCSQQERPR